ncbi:hypothetical protein ES319_D01G102000v1 [Gossypium barbadense]|uniref:Uncharacterized protein isoform X1 n=10 Tax=Gossypium TaxID=3633 RepID=A0A1U8KW41_GOSHI|nr:uncharacterized protein LOC105782710 isoform X1 [Gossypium raimondii]XP_016706645.1 uncharacterized protein LOC107921283 isoform X1 [Gossypium hirsutum]KAB2044587.1 hypothetical protein ES319_D01G102000v1 [Gossypium barbadense]TYG82713.1 hypothetical protein ES288_D01G111800v1 [Gossypium darwinii]TYH87306.1 hypothetical protein ES332_D01G108400v1 [Gossypium tomentosum]
MQATRRNFKLAVAARMQYRTSQRQNQQKRRLRTVNSRMKRLRVEMKEITAEQREIKEGQRQVREKFEAIELQCEELRKETMLMTQQSAKTQIRLALMFQILKARQNQELDKAAILTHALREVVAREEQELDASKK